MWCTGNFPGRQSTFNHHEDLFENKLLIRADIAETGFREAYPPDHALSS
ncbi:hypothetical protein AB0F03_35535 [Streptomyces sp. NPDC028722]